MKRRERGVDNVYEIDQEQPLPPEQLRAPPAGSGDVVALLVEEGPRTQGWAARLALALASKWSSPDLRVLLADADLSGATLHELLGQENHEGVADLVLYGASRTRVTREVHGGAHLFMSAGTVVCDAEEAYRHARWPAFLADARNGGTVLLLYLPSESESANELASTADRVIRVTSARPAEDAYPDLEVIHGQKRDEDEHPAPGTDVTTEVRPSEISVAPTALGSVSHRHPAIKRRVSPPYLLALIVVLLAVVVLAWFGYLDIPGLDIGPGSSSLGSTPSTPLFPIQPPGPTG